MTYDQWSLAIGLLLLLDWIAFLPVIRVGFSRYESAGFTVNDRFFRIVLATVWLAAITAWISAVPAGRLAGSFVLSVVFRHYFITQRWSSVRRGFGAPGFMAHWAARAVFVIELIRHLDQDGQTLQLIVAVVRWDFGWIMVCAGVYKLLVGYLRNNGMEYGRVNPVWGYHWRFFKDVSPHGWYPTLLNYLACLVEVVAGVMILVPLPTTQWLGAIALTLSFIYVTLFIRLGRLSALMAVLPFIAWASVADSVPLAPGLFSASPAGEALLAGVRMAAWTYAVLLPVVKVTQYLNLFLNLTLPTPLQRWLTAYANWVPIIIWRVFTADVTDFYLRVWGCDESGRPVDAIIDEQTYSRRGWARPWFKLRLLHVTESIALVSVFTTLKYFPSNRQLFDDKLRRYTSSLLLDWGRTYPVIRFEYLKVTKSDRRFEYLHMGDFVLDTLSGEVREEHVRPGFSFADPAQYSPVRESVAPGSWVPKIET